MNYEQYDELSTTLSYTTVKSSDDHGAIYTIEEYNAFYTTSKNAFFLIQSELYDYDSIEDYNVMRNLTQYGLFVEIIEARPVNQQTPLWGKILPLIDRYTILDHIPGSVRLFENHFRESFCNTPFQDKVVNFDKGYN